MRAPLVLQNLLAQRRQRQLGSELGGGIADVESGVHFDEIERDQAIRIGDELHQRMGLAVIQSALHGRSHARRKGRIADVEIERHMKTAGGGGRDLQRTFGNRGDAFAIDLLDGEDVDAGP